MNALTALSPLDGRYAKTGARLAPLFSEDALIRHRLMVMHAWVRYLVQHEKVPTPELSPLGRYSLLHFAFDPISARPEIVKDIETKGHGRWRRTNHDVKACEFFLRDFLEEHEQGALAEWIHFGCTSEDVNNLAYALMLSKGVDVLLDAVANLSEMIANMGTETAGTPMIARTHGQPATPTTLGKEFAVFEKRVDAFISKLQDVRIRVKWNGASGNYNAATFTLPEIDWQDVAYDFVQKVASEHRVTLEFNTHTTQIEPHDTYAELFDLLSQLNTVLIGFSQDIWRYVSDDWLVQKAVEGEVGSSAMPHKVNPIDFENAEGNLGITNALLQHFARKLPISRLQRDLSDSTVERNFGMAFGYCLLGYEAITRGLKKVSPNEAKIRAALADHPEVLTEAYQTILRSVNYPNAYDALKGLARGKKITLEDLHAFVEGLDESLVSREVKNRMLALTPETYLGRAPQLAKQE